MSTQIKGQKTVYTAQINFFKIMQKKLITELSIKIFFLSQLL